MFLSYKVFCVLKIFEVIFEIDMTASIRSAILLPMSSLINENFDKIVQTLTSKDTISNHLRRE